MLKLGRIFLDHCVLQQGKPCKIWGTADAGSEVLAVFQNNICRTVTDGAGNWRVTLKEPEVCQSATLLVTCGEEQICLKNVAVGEVWLLGGQSNMEFYMRYEKHLKEERKKKREGIIRFYDFPEISYEGNEEDFDYSRFGFWREASEENLEYFSAVGYYFADYLNARTAENGKEPVPIGLIGCNWGGTPCCAWMDEAHVLKHGRVWQEDYEEAIHRYRTGLPDDYRIHTEWAEEAAEGGTSRRAYEEAYRSSPNADRGNPFADREMDALLYGVSHERQEAIMEMLASFPAPEHGIGENGPFSPNRPAGLYHTMVEKIAPYSIRGVLWYQGESDMLHPEQYAEVFGGLVESWRQLWEEELPFLFVQLCPLEKWLGCDGTAFPVIRQKQMEAADRLKQVYLVSSADCGERYDIHPKNKKTIGHRLGRKAIRYLYADLYEKKEEQADSPRLAAAERILTDGKIEALALEFEAAYEGIHARGRFDQEIEIRYAGGAGEKLSKAEYRIWADGKYLRIKFLNPVWEKVCIRYCWRDYYIGNLYNSVGLPMFPFQVTV